MRAHFAALIAAGLLAAVGCSDAGTPPGTPAVEPEWTVQQDGSESATIARMEPVDVDVRALIGLIPSTDTGITEALAAGVLRALAEARDAGGPDLELRVAEAEESWGAVAGTAVRLALDEGALAIIAPPERERAHAIAQMGTRAHVPIVSTSPWASVAQAGSTWVKVIVPPMEEPRVDPAADWEAAGAAAAEAILEMVRGHGLERRRWR